MFSSLVAAITAFTAVRAPKQKDTDAAAPAINTDHDTDATADLVNNRKYHTSVM